MTGRGGDRETLQVCSRQGECETEKQRQTQINLNKPINR